MNRRGFLKSLLGGAAVAVASPALGKIDFLSLPKAVPISEPLAESEILAAEAVAGNQLVTSAVVAKEALKILQDNLKTINIAKPPRYKI